MKCFCEYILRVQCFKVLVDSLVMSQLSWKELWVFEDKTQHSTSKLAIILICNRFCQTSMIKPYSLHNWLQILLCGVLLNSMTHCHEHSYCTFSWNKTCSLICHISYLQYSNMMVVILATLLSYLYSKTMVNLKFHPVILEPYNYFELYTCLEVALTSKWNLINKFCPLGPHFSL